MRRRPALPNLVVIDADQLGASDHLQMLVAVLDAGTAGQDGHLVDNAKCRCGTLVLPIDADRPCAGDHQAAGVLDAGAAGQAGQLTDGGR